MANVMKFDIKKFSLNLKAATRSIATSSSVSAKESVYYPSKSFRNQAFISDLKNYRDLHDLSLSDPYAFWGSFVKEFHWKKPPTAENFLKFNFDTRIGPIFINWMDGAEMNVSYNVVDRHVRNGKGNKVAFYW